MLEIEFLLFIIPWNEIAESNKACEMLSCFEYVTVLFSKNVKSFYVAIRNVWPCQFYMSPMIYEFIQQTCREILLGG